MKLKTAQLLISIIFLSYNSQAQILGFLKSEKRPNKKTSVGFTISQKSLKRENPNYDKLNRNTVEKEKYSKLECPTKSPKKPNKVDLPLYETTSKANLIRSSALVHFDLVELEDVHLNIPAFKLFKNNMTDFTADGEHEFKEIVQKIDHFLGNNHEGKGVSLKIVGSASQIPTSFDQSLPNNNINANGSSIPGQTSIQNNKKLAKARADELAHKIKAIFPSIVIEIPTLDEIEIGKTPWTREVQKALNQAAMRGDKDEVFRIYEPFQKDQWVKVESKDRTSRTIQPESIKMFKISTTPYLKMKDGGVETEIKSLFIVSKKTYDVIGDHHLFGNVQARDQFIKKLGLKVYTEEKNGTIRYYMLNGKEETVAFHIADQNERIYELYKLGIVDNMDEHILEDRIIADIKGIESK
ncbi:MAG: hypothetical protein ACKVOU_08905 [Cytophagales bacterium]